MIFYKSELGEGTFEDAYREALSFIVALKGVHPETLLEHIDPVPVRVRLAYDENGDLQSCLVIPTENDPEWMNRGE